MKLIKILHRFKIKKIFYILAFYFTFTSNGFSTPPSLPLTSLPTEILLRIFEFIDIKGAIDRNHHHPCKVSKKFWFLYNNTVLSLKHPQMVHLKNPKKLQELIKIQYKIKDSSTIPCATLSSELKYTAFKLLESEFKQSDIALLIVKFPKLKILHFSNTKIIHFQNTNETLSLPETTPLLEVPMLNNIQLEVLNFYKFNLNELPSLASLKKLTQLHLRWCTNFNNASLLEEISSLKELEIGGVQLPENFLFPKDSQLETLIIYNINLSNLPSFENFKKLKSLTFINCTNFNPNFSLPTQLKSFLFENSGSLPSHFFVCDNQLEELKINDYKESPFPNLNSLKNLKKLTLIQCSSLDNFQCFNSMPQLKGLIIENTPFPSEPYFIASLVHLENLELHGVKISRIPFSDLLEKLKNLSILSCPKLRDFSFLLFTPQIKSLNIELCHLDQVPYLTRLRNLKDLTITETIIDEIDENDEDIKTTISNLLFSEGNFKRLEKFEIF